MFFISYRKYTEDEIKDFLFGYHFELIQYISSTNIIVKDKDGYKYKVNRCNLLDDKIPSKWMKNPFVIENIQLYLSINHPNYIWLDNEYHGVKEKMRFMCTNHINKGIQYNTWDNIVNNHHVCKYCAYEQMRDDRILSLEQVTELCNNKKMIYVDRFTREHETYIKYICPFHNNIIQDMSLSHFKSSNIPCKLCTITSGELRIQNYLINHNVEYKTQHIFPDCKNIKPLKFDFYLPKINTVIEYDGQQHFTPINFGGSKENVENSFKENQKRDKIKNEYCKINNINIIRIPYWDYENIEKILSVKI